MDGYDSGWLSPEGKFYGENGEANSFIHLRISEKLNPGNSNPDWDLEKKGWLKIHHDEVYGYFKYKKNDEEGLWCPTNEQLKLIFQYIDKYYDGLFYTSPRCSLATGDKKSFHTSEVRQMDEIRLHTIFSR